MGLIAKCDFTIDGGKHAGEAHLETSELFLRAKAKVTIPFASIVSAEARAGLLVVKYRDGEAVLHLGKSAETWALKIRYPRSRVEKLGVKTGLRVALHGIKDAAVVAELKATGAKVTTRLGVGPYDIILVRLDANADLPRLVEAKKRIVSNGMVWAVWPKGKKEFREDEIRGFGLKAGLVDVKVMSFSDELSGLKLVIPVAQRPT